jgi:hypothetical protein
MNTNAKEIIEQLLNTYDDRLKVRMSIADINREGNKLAVTININDAEITLFNFDEERSFPLRDLIITTLSELESK